MRNILNKKNLILLLSMLALGLLVLLASSLRGLEFHPGVSFNFDAPTEIPTLGGALGSSQRAVPLWQQTFFWIALCLLAILLVLLMMPEQRKRMLRILFNLILTVYVVSYLVDKKLISLPFLNQGEGMAAGQSASSGEVAPPVPVFVAPEASSALTYIITLVLLLTFLISAWLLIRWWNRMRPVHVNPDELRDLAGIARRSLRDLSAGREWQGVIQECYARMSETVDKKRGIHREEAMTPTEFARRMEKAGLPSDPVERLTRLFEAVRYGARRTSQRDVDEAVSCLTAILQYCGEAV